MVLTVVYEFLFKNNYCWSRNMKNMSKVKVINSLVFLLVIVCVLVIFFHKYSARFSFGMPGMCSKQIHV